VSFSTNNRQYPQPSQQNEITSDIPKVDSIVNTFFQKYKVEGSSPAIDYIFSTNPLLTDKSQLDGVKSKLDSTRKVIGAYYGNSLITRKNVSSDLILLTYLVKHERQPIRFSFIFYKAINNWTLFKFQYDDDVISELEDSGKIYFIK
jgi:hypothetical protein